MWFLVCLDMTILFFYWLFDVTSSQFCAVILSFISADSILRAVWPFQDAKKGVLFIDFPPVLQLQLKRFEYDFMRDTMVKVSSLETITVLLLAFWFLQTWVYAVCIHGLEWEYNRS